MSGSKVQDDPNAAGNVRRVCPAMAVPAGKLQVLLNRQPRGRAFRQAEAPPLVGASNHTKVLVSPFHHMVLVRGEVLA